MLRAWQIQLLVDRGRLQLIQGERAVAAGEGWVEIDCLLKKALCSHIVVGRSFAKMPQTALICRPGIKALRWLAHGASQLGVCNGGGKGGRQRFGEFVLHSENIGEIAVVALGPHMVAGSGLYQLRSDADPIAGLAHAAFEHIAHAEFASDLLHIDRSTLVGEGGVPGDDEQRGIVR
ncbi:hypothetical protein GWG65_23965 [Bradyrhizobium sp. CSA207]|nr:hypothetical protein [Bradyrhizobium sp. CSA207]